MTPRLVARLIVVLALVGPVAATAQTFIQKAKPDVPSNLSLTLSPTRDAPARLKYASGGATFDAQSQTMQVTYAATGLTVEMGTGSFTATEIKEPWKSRSRDTFKTLYLTFATNGDMVALRIID